MFSQVSVILFTGADTPPGHTPPGQTPNTALGQTPPTPWTDPLGSTPSTPQQMATEADGTHPTGMHSCCLLIILFVKRKLLFFAK